MQLGRTEAIDSRWVEGQQYEPPIRRAQRTYLARTAPERRFPPILDSAIQQVLVNRRAVLETDDPKPPAKSGSDCAASAARFVPFDHLPTVPYCVPSSGAHGT